MFSRKNREAPTTYDRLKTLNMNQIFCFGALGVVVYSFIQGLLEEGDSPIWFLIVMPLLIVCTSLVAIYNFVQIKKLKAFIAEINKETTEKETESDILVVEDNDEALENEVSKYDG